MRNLLRSEWRKVVTTKLWWALLLAAMAVTALEAVGQIGSVGTTTMRVGPPGAPLPPPPPNPLLDPSQQRSLATAAATGGIFALLIGIIIVTTEFRHLTSRPTLLIQPRRGRVVIAKVIVAAAVGALYAVASAVILVAIMAPWLGAEGVSIGWISHGVLGIVARSMLTVVIYAVVGVGIGVLVRNQLAAVIGSLAFFLVVETLIGVIPGVQRMYPLLPGPAAAQLAGSQVPSVGGPTLTPLEGGLLFAGWALAIAFAATMTVMRRDVP